MDSSYYFALSEIEEYRLNLMLAIMCKQLEDTRFKKLDKPRVKRD